MSYILAKAAILKFEKKYDEALALLETALPRKLKLFTAMYSSSGSGDE